MSSSFELRRPPAQSAAPGRCGCTLGRLHGSSKTVNSWFNEAVTEAVGSGGPGGEAASPAWDSCCWRCLPFCRPYRHYSLQHLLLRPEYASAFTMEPACGAILSLYEGFGLSAQLRARLPGAPQLMHEWSARSMQ